MDKAMYSLYDELLREAREKYWIPVSVTSRLAKKAEKAKQGKDDFSGIVIYLIREIEKYIQRNIRGEEQKSAMIYVALKRNQFMSFKERQAIRGSKPR